MRVMISLVGGRPLPNILVALHLKPDILYFVVSADSAGPNGEFEKTIAALPERLRPRDNQIVVVKPYIMTESVQACKDFADRHPDDEVICNASLGPKTMAFGMYDAARVLRTQGRSTNVCYLGRDELIWVFERPIEPVRINLEKYFECYGWQVSCKSDVESEKFRALSKLLASNVITAGQLLPLMRQYDRGRERRTIHYQKALSNDQFMLLKEIEELQVVSNVRRDEGASWTINSQEDGQFLLDGGWLEYYTYFTATGLMQQGKPLFHECRWEVEDRKGKGEIDFAGILNGQLVIASCKTESELKRQYLEELHSKAEQLGKGMCSTLLISTVAKANRKPEALAEYEKWAKERQIVLVFAEDLARLDQILKKVSLSDQALEPLDVPTYRRI